MHSFMKTRIEALLDYCAALAGRSNLLFILLLSLTNIVISVLVGFCLEQFGIHEVNRPELLSLGVVGLFFITIIFGPATETFLFQQLPITAARQFGAPAYLQFAFGAVPFAMLHLSAGAGGIAAGLSGGLVLSLAYLTFIAQSKTRAFCMTAVVHALHNLVPFVLYARELP